MRSLAIDTRAFERGAPPKRRGRQARPSLIDAERLAAFTELLLGWYERNGVRLPWRDRPTPYAVLVSEIMLQQTGRDRVAAKFDEFLERFPTLEALAEAPLGAVIRAWQGLGYNRRAVRLHAIARAAVARGGLPRDVEALRELPGIGAYTAGAIACFAFGADVAFADTNIRRVLCRVLLGEADRPASAGGDAQLADAALPPGRAFAWNSALMDLGATVCKARAPRCDACPVASACRFRERAVTGEAESASVSGGRSPRRVAEAASSYRPAQRWQESDRYLRGRIVQALRDASPEQPLPLAELTVRATGHALPLLPEEGERVARLVDRLADEGLIERSESADGPAFRLPG